MKKVKIKNICSAEEEGNDVKHDEDVTGAGGSFYPLVVESFGVWTRSSLQSLKMYASKTTTKSTVTFQQAWINLMG